MYYLYLKTHNLTGLKYLGFTSKDPHIYKGSGLHWLRHLKKHGSDINTLILYSSEDKSDITRVGREYSILWDVVKSTDFANLTMEEGTGGATWLGKTHTKESIKKMSDVKKGKVFTETHRANLSKSLKGKLSGANNPFHGKEHSVESKAKMSQSLKGKVRSEAFKEHLSNLNKGKAKIVVICPHCQKSGGKPVMTRYHFDNCKSSPDLRHQS